MKKKCFLNHFNLSKKSGDDITNIETLYYQTVFDVWINDKFLDKDQSFQDTLCHKLNKFNNMLEYTGLNVCRNLFNNLVLVQNI
jgi:hypothetical protein